MTAVSRAEEQGSTVRSFGDYTSREWLSALPLAHRARRIRNIGIQALYRSSRTPNQEAFVASVRPLIEGRVAAFTVAFNVPRTIELLADGVARHGSQTVLIVCDNSSSLTARLAIAAACAQRNVPYISLPPPPLARFLAPNPARSHGLALTWIFYNLVRPLKPQIFAFLDHDLIPLRPFDLRESLGTQPIYGVKSDRLLFGSWSLWAGYCMYNYKATAHLPMDFGTDVPLGLDTGGQNWTVLYRHLRPEGLRFAPYGEATMQLDPNMPPVAVEIADDRWLHVRGLSHRQDGLGRLKVAEEIIVGPTVSQHR